MVRMTDLRTSPAVPAWDLTDRLHKALRVADLDVKEMATVLGVHRNTVSNYLSGRTEPTRAVLIAWALRGALRLAAQRSINHRPRERAGQGRSPYQMVSFQGRVVQRMLVGGSQQVDVRARMSAMRRVERDTPERPDQPVTTNTLRPHVGRYLHGRHQRGEISRRTADNLECRLHGLEVSFGNRPVNQLGRRAIERWLATIGHHSPATRRAYLSTVSVFCRWLVREGVLRSDPTADIVPVREPRSVPRALAASDVARVLAAVPNSRGATIVWLMVGLGLRCAEVAGLELADYDPVARIVTVTGKAGHQRAVPVPAEAARQIDLYVAEVGLRAGPLIRSFNNPAVGLSGHAISVLVARWMSTAGVKHRSRDGVSAHAFRHTAASDVLDKCHDLRVVQAMLGHAHLSSTAIYLRRANLGQIREAMEGRTYRAA